MFTMLFQMALIPLTMSRLSIASLSETFVERIVPLNCANRVHIYLGYMVTIVVSVVSIMFVVFFAVLCSGGDEDSCTSLKSEIMITGYAILFVFIIIGITAYYRHVIPYEIFYTVHHLVFVMYILTVAHTFDDLQREGEEDRNQTYKWFSASIMYYVCDRAAMHLNHRYKAKLLLSSAVAENDGSKVIFLKLRRPVLFRFKPGQYAFLRLPDIDIQWHPFSMASSPDSTEIEFCIEVREPGSWTDCLCKILLERKVKGKEKDLFIEVLGPYGTSLAKTNDFTRAVAVGGGTGKNGCRSILFRFVLFCFLSPSDLLCWLYLTVS